MKNTVIFYETESGNCPVADFLHTLPVKHHTKAVRNLELLEEFGRQLGGGLIDHIHEEIWELRTRFGNDISQIASRGHANHDECAPEGCWRLRRLSV